MSMANHLPAHISEYKGIKYKNKVWS